LNNANHIFKLHRDFFIAAFSLDLAFLITTNVNSGKVLCSAWATASSPNKNAAKKQSLLGMRYRMVRLLIFSLNAPPYV